MAESESLESSESFAASASFENLSSPETNDVLENETADAPNDTAAGAVKYKHGLFADFNIYNAMLMASLVLILLATVLVFGELAGYGGLDGSWRTGSVGR